MARTKLKRPNNLQLTELSLRVPAWMKQQVSAMAKVSGHSAGHYWREAMQVYLEGRVIVQGPRSSK
jgi:predicted DNA-binding protein